MKPRRIHLNRTKGWRKPSNCVSVGRPTEWGNRYVVGREPLHIDGRRVLVRDRSHGVQLYREWLDDQLRRFPSVRDRIRHELGGRDLGCFCPLDVPCHADVLIEVANPAGY
jgi:hypothetical protein